MGPPGGGGGGGGGDDGGVRSSAVLQLFGPGAGGGQRCDGRRVVVGAAAGGGGGEGIIVLVPAAATAAAAGGGGRPDGGWGVGSLGAVRDRPGSEVGVLSASATNPSLLLWERFLVVAGARWGGLWEACFFPCMKNVPLFHCLSSLFNARVFYNKYKILLFVVSLLLFDARVFYNEYHLLLRQGQSGRARDSCSARLLTVY